MAKLDIIIPVYNAERYVEQCLKSLISQSYTEWNAICIDDGSTDQSGLILDKYAKSDSRISVKHIKNSGSIKARLEGINQSNAEWIAFVDADDTIDHLLFSELIRLAAKYNSDIVCCEHQTMSSHGYHRPIKASLEYVEKTYSGSYIAPFFSGGTFVNCGLWGKLYKRELFKKQYEQILRIPNVFWGEYTMINSLIFEVADLVVVTNAPLYFYRYGGGSSKNSFNRLKELAALYNWRKKFLEKYKNPQFNKNNISQVLNAAIFYCTISTDIISRSDACALLQEPIDDMLKILPDYKKRDAFDPAVSMLDKDFCKLYSEKISVRIKKLLLQLF